MRWSSFRTAPRRRKNYTRKCAEWTTQKKGTQPLRNPLAACWNCCRLWKLLLGIVVGGFLCASRVGCRGDRLHKGPGHFRSGDLAQKHGPERHVPAVNGVGGVGILLDNRAFQRQSGKSALGARIGQH